MDLPASGCSEHRVRGGPSAELIRYPRGMPPTKSKTKSNVVPISDRLLAATKAAMRSGGAPAPAPTSGATEYPVVAPKDVLPHPKDLACVAAWDTETSNLYVDDGGRVAIVSVAFCTKDDPDTIQAYAFPFDQGRAFEKGFEPQYTAAGKLKANSNLHKLMEWEPGQQAPIGFSRVGGTLEVDLPAWDKDINLGEQEWRDMCRWLELAGKYVGLTGQNDKFDVLMTEAGTRQWSGVWLEEFCAWDTMLGSKNLWPTLPTGLKPTSARLWGDQEADEAREVKNALAVQKKLYGLTADHGPRYDLLPWSIIGPYATQDAVLTLRLTKYQIDLFDEGLGDWRDMNRNMDLMRTLCRLERRGFGPINKPLAREVAEAIEVRIAQLEAMMPFQPPTDYRAKEYFFDDLGMRPWRGAEEPREIELYTNKKGEQSKKIVKQGSLNTDVCARMAEAGVQFAGEFGELLRLRTANRMNYRGYLNLAGRDGKLRTTFRQAHVRSGRMSVERWQAQAVPRRDSVKIKELPGYGVPPHPRDLFMLADGYTRCTIDLSQAELRVAAKFSGAKRMIEQIYEGRDIHGETATQIFGVQPEDKDAFKHYRYIAKRGVFGGIFMVGPKTFRNTIWDLAGIWLPWSDAQKTVYGFRDLYPEIEQAYNREQQFVMQHGYVELMDGTKSWFGPRDYDNTAWNRKVQGSLALFNMDWLVEVERRTADLNALVLSVHDSVTLDLPSDIAVEVCEDIAAWTATAFEGTFGIIGSADIEYEW